jgi:PAS domain S-box-containing protein
LQNIVSQHGIYKYQHLPLLARFILDGHINEFAVQQLHLSRQYDVPLLRLLSNYSDEQLLEISSESIKEILGYLANNQASEQIASSLQKWIANQMVVVDKYDIVAEDITLLSHVRSKSLKNFAARFYSDSNEALLELLSEIDDFILASNTSSANTFITILKDRIHEEEEFRSKLSNALPAFLYVYDLNEGREIHSNNKLIDILGYSAQQVKEMSADFYKCIMHPEDWTRIDALRKNSGTNGAVTSFEYRLKDIRDNNRWIRNYETNLRTADDGTRKEIIGVAFDVTGEKEITEALAKSETQLLEAQSLAHIGSFEWDITGQKSTTNTPEIYKIFELQEMEKFEKFMQYVHRDDVKKVEDELKQSFVTGNYECVYRYLRNDKEKIIWSKGVVTIDNGTPVKMVGTVQDVTTIKLIEAELKQKTIELEKSNESLQQFASVASHDLKEPLRKISIYGSKVLNVESANISEDSKAALSKILDSASRMQQMINDILQFSFIEESQQKQETNLEEVLAEVKELLSETIADKKATIISDGLPSAFVVASQIRQLFQNLISNSLKFSKANEPPVINITHSYLIDKPAAAAEKRQLQICVSDNGIGFDEEDHEKIFALFYRLHSRSKFEGSGLGLSICNKIVEKHGGKITAESQPGKGSTFKIILPKALNNVSQKANETVIS